MHNKRGLRYTLVCFSACVFFFLSFIGNASAQESFQLGSILLKVSVPQGTSVSKSASITADEGGEFLFSTNVEGVTLAQKRVVMQRGESKTIGVTFNAQRLEPGVYVGGLKVLSGKEIATIPIVFEVESKDILFDVNLDIPPDYAEVQPGERVVANLKVFDLASGGTSEGFGPTPLNVEYYIYTIEGSVVSSESESVVVDRQVQISKSVSLPSSLKEGTYVFAVIARYKTSVGISSYLFQVSKQKSGGFSFFESSGNWEIYAILGVVVLFFFILIFLFVYLIRDRDKMFLELKQYNEWELRQHKHLLGLQEKRLIQQRKVKPALVHREVAAKLNVLKEKQKARVVRLRTLKGKGSADEMQRQLSAWKKGGYNTGLLEYKLKGLSNGEMRNILSKWKKKYHAEGYKNKR